MSNFHLAVNTDDNDEIILIKTFNEDVENMYPTCYIPLKINLAVSIIHEGERKTKIYPFYSELEMQELFSNVPEEDILSEKIVRPNIDPYRITMLSLEMVSDRILEGLEGTGIQLKGNIELEELVVLTDPEVMSEEINISVVLHDASNDIHLHAGEAVQNINKIAFVPLADTSDLFDLIDEPVKTLGVEFVNEEL